ncbi:MAG TPA: FecR family protein, partial [Bryobacteraceae bacterium]
MKRMIMGLVAAGTLLAAGAWAQDNDAGRGVARISVINGDVSVRRGDSGDWVAAAVNAPLVVDDSVLTGGGSRAEVQYDYANFLRLGDNAEVRLAGLETNRYQVQVARGTVMFRVLRDSNANVEIDTPNVSVRPVKRGMYRITVRDGGESEVTVRRGEAEAFTPRGAERLQSGRTMLVRGTQADPEFQVTREVAEDYFDQWNEDRDRRLERTKTYQYVGRDVYGAEDLDDYGRWVYDSPYGWVWSPYGMAADWAPYRYGRWAWVDWYGWSWVSYDPWGWAPYH